MLNLIHSPDIIDRRANIANIVLSTGVAHIITGPRRCGKSEFAFQIIQSSKYGYVNFDDDRLGITPSEFAKVEIITLRCDLWNIRNLTSFVTSLLFYLRFLKISHCSQSPVRTMIITFRMWKWIKIKPAMWITFILAKINKN
jgi:hypothetical protein